MLAVGADRPTIASVRSAIARLYRGHPGVARFAVQDVSYSAGSRARVLAACLASDGRATSAVQTSRLLACAPLVFFYSEYGRRSGIREATAVADSIYTYAATAIHGPLDSEAVIDGVMRGWGLPLAAASAPAGPSPSPAAVALVAGVRRAILARHSVRLQIIEYRSGGRAPSETVTAAIGTDMATEVLREPESTATIRLTPAAAYISGNASGLRTLIGLPRAAAKGASGRWLRAANGSAEYQNLVAQDTLRALPASVLPASGASVSARPAAGTGRVRQLRWSSTTSAGGEVHAALNVAAGRDPLPISETTTAGADRETVRFSGWDEPLVVTPPR